MDLLKNVGLLRTLLIMVGISNIKTRTDTPEALITLEYERKGVQHTSKFTLQELLRGYKRFSAFSPFFLLTESLWHVRLGRVAGRPIVRDVPCNVLALASAVDAPWSTSPWVC